MSTSQSKPAWLIVAVASGVCAAFNGVFAKLTTTELTTSIAAVFGTSKLIEYVVRALFFGLNLVFNAIMWGLFTRALTLASSTVRVSIINTSANFIVTAVLSFLIFSESLPGLWWLGAALLVAGSVIIGMREESETKDGAAKTGDALSSISDSSNIQRNRGFRDLNENEEEYEQIELRGLSKSASDNSDDDVPQSIRKRRSVELT
ncbi:hypothetical protein ACN47E_009340 [Coniothyrium glycines]